MSPFSRARALAAEAVGTAFLLSTVVGSGIMGESLAAGNIAVALLTNAIATGAILVVLIFVFGPVSGGHFNPAVTLSFLLRGEIGPMDAALYVAVQVLAAVAGVLIAHAMFDLSLLQVSLHQRSGISQWFAEGIATFGLVMVILGCVDVRKEAVAYAVGLYITAAYFFTASTSFANPAVTIARSLTDTFSGIAPAGVGMFIVAQLAGAVLATGFMAWLFRSQRD